MKKPLIFTVSMLALAMIIASGIAVLPGKTVKADSEIQIDSTKFPDGNFRNWLKRQTYGKDGVLTEEEIEFVTRINVQRQNITSLKGIEFFTFLNYLDCGGNKLTELDVSKNISLSNLNCSGNNIVKLDISKNKNISILNCGYNQITAIDLKNNNLEILRCSCNKLKKLDLKDQTQMREFECFGNEIQSIDISGNPNLITCYTKSQPAHYVVYLGSGRVDYIDYSYYDEINEESYVMQIDEELKVNTVPTITLKLDKKTSSIVCGQTTILKATLAGSKDKVTWKSSDTKIATVDANGKVTTKMAGTVTITASAAGKKARCTVTVLYKDVTDSKEFWYAPTNYLTKNGIVKGYDNQTLFKPTNECSRAQMVTFLWRLAGQPNPKKTTTDFKDIKTTDYFYKPVLWAVEMGITTGVSKTSFNPQGICTRAQTVTFLWRMAGKPAPKSKDCKFTDIKTTDYFYKATLWASEMKIVAGYDDNTFRPQGKCLRRQMVTFLYKYDKYVNGKG